MSVQEVSGRERSGYELLFTMGQVFQKMGLKDSCFGEDQRRPIHPAGSFCGLSKGLDRQQNPFFPKPEFYRPVCTYHLMLRSPSLQCPWLPHVLHLLHLPHPPPRP